MATLWLSHPFIPVTVFHVTSSLMLHRMMTISLKLDWRSWSKIQAEKDFCKHFMLLFSSTGKRLLQRYQMETLPQLFQWDLGYRYLLQSHWGGFGQMSQILCYWTSAKMWRGDTWWAQVCCRSELEAKGELWCGTVGLLKSENSIATKKHGPSLKEVKGFHVRWEADVCTWDADRRIGIESPIRTPLN